MCVSCQSLARVAAAAHRLADGVESVLVRLGRAQLALVGLLGAEAVVVGGHALVAHRPRVDQLAAESYQREGARRELVFGQLEQEVLVHNRGRHRVEDHVHAVRAEVAEADNGGVLHHAGSSEREGDVETGSDVRVLVLLRRGVRQGGLSGGVGVPTL